MKIGFVLPVLILLCAANAAAYDWPMFGRTPAHSLYADDYVPADLAQVWSVSVPFSSWFYASPIVAEQKVFAGSTNGVMYSYDYSTGAAGWNYSTQSQIRSTAAYYNGALYFTAANGILYKINASSGQQVWNTTIGDASVGCANSQVIIYDNIVFASICYYNLTAVNASSGEIIWAKTWGTYSDTVAVDDGILVSGYSRQGLNAFNGSVLWTDWMIGQSTAAIVDGIAYYMSNNDYIVAVNVGNGTQAWNYTAGSGGYWHAPTVYQDMVLYCTNSDVLLSLNKSSGQPLWNASGCYQSSPVIVNQTIFTSASTGINSFSLNGTLINHTAVIVDEIAVSDGMIYGISPSSGVLYALGSERVSTGNLPMNSGWNLISLYLT